MSGFVKFDAHGWDEGEPAKVAKAANPDPTLATFATLAGVLAAGVATMNPANPPGAANPQAWSCLIRDCAKLIDGDWTAKALALGWSDLDLFGATLDPTADPYCVGLAAWLEGRTVLALTDGWAVASDRNGNRAYFSRPRAEGARLAWQLGR